jgi:ankyrin repeat protein
LPRVESVGHAAYGHLMAEKKPKPRASRPTNAQLFAAIDAEDTELVEKLCEQGIDVGARNASGETLVEFACLKREFSSAHALIEAGAGATVRPEVVARLYRIAKEGTYAPLDEALYYGLADVAEALIEGGAPINVKGQDKFSALNRAAYGGFDAICRELIARGADLESTNGFGYTPLFTAVGKGRVAVAKILIAAGANPNIATKTKDGRSLLDMAAKKAPLLALIQGAQAKTPAANPAKPKTAKPKRR